MEPPTPSPIVAVHLSATAPVTVASKEEELIVLDPLVLNTAVHCLARLSLSELVFELECKAQFI